MEMQFVIEPQVEAIQLVFLDCRVACGSSQ
jgi:hypothetical protein